MKRANLWPAAGLQSGAIAQVTGTAANVWTIAVTFPLTYPAAPNVVASSTANAGIEAHAISASTTGFTLRATWVDGANHTGSGTAAWIALPS